MRPKPLCLTLPWCEADDDAYAAAIRAALDAADANIDAFVGGGRVALTLHVYPAHYSACTLPDCICALYDAMDHLGHFAFRDQVARIDCRFEPRDDAPRLEMTIARA